MKLATLPNGTADEPGTSDFAAALDAVLALASRNPDVLCSCCRQLSRVLESRDLKVAVVAADYLARIHALPGVSGQGSATAWAVVEQGLRAPDLETRRRARTALTFSLGPRDACVAVLLGQSDDIALRSERREIGQALGTIAVDYAAAWPDSHAPVVDPDLLLGFLIGVARSDASRPRLWSAHDGGLEGNLRRRVDVRHAWHRVVNLVRFASSPAPFWRAGRRKRRSRCPISPHHNQADTGSHRHRPLSRRHRPAGG